MVEPDGTDNPDEEEIVPPPVSIKKDTSLRVKKKIDFHLEPNEVIQSPQSVS